MADLLKGLNEWFDQASTEAKRLEDKANEKIDQGGCYEYTYDEEARERMQNKANNLYDLLEVVDEAISNYIKNLRI